LAGRTSASVKLSSAASARAIADVPSVLALSAITIRHANGMFASRKPCRRRIERSSADRSL
jgi:hypothetical protein